MEDKCEAVGAKRCQISGERTVEKRDDFVPEGLDAGSPTPQGLRRDRSAWVDKIEGFECDVTGSEGPQKQPADH
jgi:hypothetical protein